MKTSSLFRRLAATALAAVGVVSPLAAKSSAAVDLRIELDRPVLPADSAQRAIVKVALTGGRLERVGERPPVNLVVVLDRSGSMSGDKIEKAREAAIEALRRLDRRDFFSLVVFDHEVSTVIAPQHPTETYALERQIRAINSRGNTAIYAGVNQGAAELRKNLEREDCVHRVLLLSDGLANIGPSSPADLGRLGAALRKERIAVTTIGLGEGFNEDLMAALAQRSDGNHYFVAESGDLPRIFAAELGDVLNVCAKEVVVKIRFPGGVRVIRSIGREAECRDGEAEFSLNQLYGGQEKYLLLEVEVPAGRAGSEQTLATATARYADTDGKAQRELQAETRVTYTKDEARVKSSANLTVQTDYAYNRIAEAKDEAIALNDAGRRQEAAATLAATSASLEVMARTYSNAPAAAVAAAAKEEAKKVEADGIDNRARKAMRADNYQTKNQQSSRN